MRYYTYIFVFILVMFPLLTRAETSFTRDLSFGLENDPDVVRLQEFLRARGFFSYPNSTGNYFAITRGSVIRFQLSENITPAEGGFYGKTRQRANELLATTNPGESGVASSTFPVLFGRNLFFGLRADPDVIRLQNILREEDYFLYPESTGNYFSVTQDAVRAYQREKNIPATGSFDVLTRTFLNQDLLDAYYMDHDVLPPPKVPPASATSTFYKKIDITSFHGRDTTPNQETITLLNRTKNESISVAGWEFETSLGTRFTIPSAYNLPGMPDSALSPIVLPPGGKLTIAVGTQATYSAFRENLCTGYFTEQTKFTPSIRKQCPRIETDTLLDLDDKCLATLPTIPRCTIPKTTYFFAQSSECSNYMINHFSYAGCVRDHRNDDDFYENRWFVWLGRNTEIFRNIHETLVLRDLEGKFVDEHGY